MRAPSPRAALVRGLACALAGGVAGGLLAGCEVEEPYLSPDVATADLHFSVRAEGTATETRIEVLLAGPGGYVRLVEDDRLVLRAGIEEIPLTRAAEQGYAARVGPEHDALTLALEREMPEESAEIGFTLPPATALSVPAEASRTEPLVVRWSASPGRHRTVLGVGGSCIEPVSRELTEDPGTYGILPADIASGSDATCVVTVALTRTFAGDVPARPHQTARLHVERTATASLVSTP